MPLAVIRNSPRFRWWTYCAVALGTFITVVEQSATAIVIPMISEHFGADIPSAQWMAIGYMLAVSAFMMPAGAIADTLGKRRMWLWGLTLFSTASLMTSFSTSFGLVVTGKILMGVAASALQANGMAMVANAFPDKERGKALGFHMTAVGIGAVGGPVIGGGIESLMGWRAIFVFISIFSVLAWVAALIILDSDGIQRGRRMSSLRLFDWVGTVLSACFLLTLMSTITFAQDLGWSSPLIVGGAILGSALFVSFLFWERRVDVPMLPLGLFGRIPFSMGSAARFLSFMASSGTFFLMPFFLISGLGMGTAAAALYLLPGSATLMVFGPISGRLADRIGTLIPSFSGMVCATLAMWIFSTIRLDSDPLVVAFASALSGMGMSIFMAPNTSAIMGSAGRKYYGIVSAFMNLTRNGAHVVGIAVPTAVVVAVMATMGYEPDLSDPETLKDVGLRSAYAISMGKAFQISTVIMGIAAILSLMAGIIDRPKENRLGVLEAE